MKDFVPVSKITDREFKALIWVEPKQVMVSLRWLETHIPEGTDEKIRHLRTNQLKEWREAREAALFAYGIGDQVLEKPTFVAKLERRDFDFVMRWADDGADYFYPVQVKELPPADLNPNASLDDLLDKLEKYSGVDDLSVAIHINRRIRFEHRPWNRKTKPALRELWSFGCLSADQSKWFLFGNVLQSNPRYYEFTYPTGGPNVA